MCQNFVSFNWVLYAIDIPTHYFNITEYCCSYKLSGKEDIYVRPPIMPEELVLDCKEVSYVVTLTLYNKV